MKEKTNVRYSGIQDVIEEMNKISQDNIEIGNLFEKTINNFQSDKTLSSKVITPSMNNMIQEIKKINSDFKEDCNRYTEFLNNEVKDKYNKTDSEIKDIWSQINEEYEIAKEM